MGAKQKRKGPRWERAKEHLESSLAKSRFVPEGTPASDGSGEGPQVASNLQSVMRTSAHQRGNRTVLQERVLSRNVPRAKGLSYLVASHTHSPLLMEGVESRPGRPTRSAKYTHQNPRRPNRAFPGQAMSVVAGHSSKGTADPGRHVIAGWSADLQEVACTHPKNANAEHRASRHSLSPHRLANASPPVGVALFHAA